ncbi:MAG TPA: minor capsid protein [Blastocatellia bacterium]|nr:minor capsid protein [Blastocatellia bacterium]
MPDVYQLAQTFRDQLDARNVVAERRLAAAHFIAFQRLKPQLDALTAKIESARARNEIISQAWLDRQARFKTLLGQVSVELQQLGAITEGVITQGQRLEIQRAIKDAGALLNASAEAVGTQKSFNQVPREALQNLVGMMGDGSPLRMALRGVSAEGLKTIKETLITGIVAGEGLNKVAARMRDALGGNLDRARSIARTEILRAHREASRETYQQNADLVEGWVWLSARQARCCVACVALHGKVFPLQKPMLAHVRCRCTLVPKLIGQPSPIEKGEDWFARQPEDVQREVFDNKSAYAAYKSGQLRLKDFVGLERSAQWGDSYNALSLKRALAGEGQFPAEPRPIDPKLIIAPPNPAPPPLQPTPPVKPEPRLEPEAALSNPQDNPITGPGSLEAYANSAPKGIELKMKADARAGLKKMFGREIADEELAWAVGALDGAQVQAYEMGDGSILVTIEHQEIDDQERYIAQEKGQVIIKNAYFRAAKGAPKGVGVRSFAREVIGAQRLGVAKIKTYAAGEGPTDQRFNGYYTWARFGYNAPLPPALRDRMPAALKSKDLHELFSKPGGPEWWRENGSGREMEFDLASGSKSERRLLEYLRERDRKR